MMLPRISDDQFLTEDVAEETQRQRHHARRVADQLDREHDETIHQGAPGGTQKCVM